MNIVQVFIENAGQNLSAYVEGAPIITVGDNLAEIKSNVQETVSLYIGACAEIGIPVADCLTAPYQFEFHYNKD